MATGIQHVPTGHWLTEYPTDVTRREASSDVTDARAFGSASTAIDVWARMGPDRWQWVPMDLPREAGR